MEEKSSEYFILCYGRTSYTKYTIDSIINNSINKTHITIINNGWNRDNIIPEVLLLWDEFINRYILQGKIHNVINISHSPNFVLDGFLIADQNAKNEYYFISDNDCIVNQIGFDEICKEKIKKYGLSKLGLDFFRTVSIEHCKLYPEVREDINRYFIPDEGGRVVKSGMETTYCEEANLIEIELFEDSGIYNNLCDTTMSVVKKGCSVNHNNRFSPTIKNRNMLHVGYLESIFNSENSLEVVEMMYYMKKRSENMKEFSSDYKKRYEDYLNKVMQNNNSIYIYYNYLSMKNT